MFPEQVSWTQCQARVSPRQTVTRCHSIFFGLSSTAVVVFQTSNMMSAKVVILYVI